MRHKSWGLLCFLMFASLAVGAEPTWDEVQLWYDQKHSEALARPLVEGLGSVLRAPSPCSDPYPTESGLEWLLSAYLITKNEKFRFDAEGQLAYAHSRQNSDRLLVHFDRDPTICASSASIDRTAVFRDYQARQLYNFYVAFKIFGEPLYLAWAEELASKMLVFLPLGSSGISSLGPGFRNGLASSEQTFSDVYYRSSDAWASTPGSYSPRPAGFTIDPNQNAGAALGFWLLANEPRSSFYNDERFRKVGIDGIAMALAAQVLSPDAFKLESCQSASGHCERPAVGALSLSQYRLWDWDQNYGGYTGFLVALGKGLAGEPSASWSDFLVKQQQWLKPYSINSSVQLVRYYVSNRTPPFTYEVESLGGTVPVNAMALWQNRVPVLFQGSSVSDPNARCSTDPALGNVLRSLLSFSDSSSDDSYRKGGAQFHSYLSLVGMPSSCYLPSIGTLPSAAEDGLPVFLIRGGRQLVKVTSVTGSQTSVPAAGHSLWKGEQRFDYPIVGVATTTRYVFVALNVNGRGRVLKYQAAASGQTMFNVAQDGFSQIPGISRQIVGYQDFSMPVTAIASDDGSTYVALGLASGGGRLVRYSIGSAGASMFNVYGDGISQVANVSAQYMGYQDFSKQLSSVYSDGSQLYVATGSRLIRYDVAFLGTGGSMLYALPDGTSPLVVSGGPDYSRQFAAERVGYQDFDIPVVAAAAGMGYLYVALSGPASSGRVIRFKGPANGSGASMLYADLSGIAPVGELWRTQFNAMNVGYQDYAKPVTGLAYRGPYVYVRTSGNTIVADPKPVTFSIKYFHHEANSSGGSMWKVARDGVTRTFCNPQCFRNGDVINPETDPNYPMSMVEFVQGEQ